MILWYHWINLLMLRKYGLIKSAKCYQNLPWIDVNPGTMRPGIMLPDTMLPGTKPPDTIYQTLDTRQPTESLGQTLHANYIPPHANLHISCMKLFSHEQHGKPPSHSHLLGVYFGYEYPYTKVWYWRGITAETEYGTYRKRLSTEEGSPTERENKRRSEDPTNLKVYPIFVCRPPQMSLYLIPL